MLFRSKERDAETGTDSFWFRQYAPNMGRWLTPDPAGLGAVDLTNPQSWNRYAYVNGDPVNAVDEDGLLTTVTIFGREPLYFLEDKEYEDYVRDQGHLWEFPAGCPRFAPCCSALTWETLPLRNIWV